MAGADQTRVSSLPTGTVTFLFTDVEGSTRLWEERPVAMKEAVATHDGVVRGAIEGRGGHVFSTAGDSFAAAFSRPEDAIGAAVEAQDALALHGWPEGCELKVRMGVHTGSAEERDGDYFGPAVNRAARLMDAGHGGQVLVSLAAEELVRDGLPDGVVLRGLGRHRLRDLSQPEHVFQVGDSEFPRLRTLEAIPNNLPAQLSSFVGREVELDRLKGVLDEHRLVTLTGVGGTGKTRLALQAAAEVLDRFEDGVYLVELATVADASLVAERIATVISAPSAPGDAVAGRFEVERLTAHLRERRVLLVLDNCEHVIDSVATVAELVLRECHEIAVLATSREALGVAGEQALRVPSLAVPPSTVGVNAEVLESYEATRLLLDRARGVDADFSVSAADAELLVEICRRLDGIPLVIELAAARVVSMSIGQVLERLHDQFRLLVGGRRTAVERHQTLRAAIDWSFELLSDGARRLMPRLGVFTGGWTLDGAETVCTDDVLDASGVADAMTELVEKSMVAVEHLEGGSRYRMVEPVRQYALEKLAAAGELERTRDRHAAWVEDRLAARSYRHAIERLNDAETQRFALSEFSNAVEAMRWLLERHDAETVARIAAASSQAVFGTGRYREALDLIKAALAHDGGSCWARYAALVISAYYALWLGDAEGAQRHAGEAATVGAECDDVSSLHFVSTFDATLAFFRGGIRSAADALEAARTEHAAEGDQYSALYATFLLGSVRGAEGDYEGALALVEEAYEPVKDLPPVGWVHYAPPWIALFKVLAGREGMEPALEDAERVARASDDPMAITVMLLAQAAAGPAERARAAVEEGVQLTRRYSLEPIFILDGLAFEAKHRDDPEGAARVLGALDSEVEDVAEFAYREDLLRWAHACLGEEVFREHYDTGAGDGAEAVIERILAD